MSTNSQCASCTAPAALFLCARCQTERNQVVTHFASSAALAAARSAALGTIHLCWAVPEALDRCRGRPACSRCPGRVLATRFQQHPDRYGEEPADDCRPPGLRGFGPVRSKWAKGCDAITAADIDLVRHTVGSLPEDDPRMAGVRALLYRLSEGMTLLSHSLTLPKENPHG